MKNNMLFLYTSLVLLLISAVVLPFAGEEADARVIGLLSLFICAYLIIDRRERDKKDKKE
ncbi:hypothetical protein SAMN04488137_1032 [Fictibacillus solisalsi]|uniref:Uncharacterized protein n=1 Tax=Fictibacillus solisalsi TaxID=459525 RepID=A0A1G9UN53_9BACL|nr:hypothetical protein SAMN04488137_1032 [Fictibacillus solisalsi]